MKVLIAHNRYQQSGGEDQVVAAEASLLSRYGHDVEHLSFDNGEIHGPSAQIRAAAGAFFSIPAYARSLRVLEKFQPDILHVHNFMPSLSPSIFFAGERARVPVVQTLHNYRLICPNALLFREGKPCEECVAKGSFFPAVQHACYRGSRAGSAVVGASMALQTRLETWTRRVSRFIVLTDFAGEKLSTRVPRSRIRVKPNFVSDEGIGTGEGNYFLFVGRLSQEKGVDSLIAADRLGELPLPVVIVGDGPMRASVEEACARPGSRLRMIGHQSSEQVRLWMKQAAALLVPSLCYEGFPMTVVEALSVGLPVIASRIGGLQEIVPEGLCGHSHTPSDPQALLQAMKDFAGMQLIEQVAMRRAARTRYLQKYSERTNYQQLTNIYKEAVSDAVSSQPSVLLPDATQQPDLIEAT